MAAVMLTPIKVLVFAEIRKSDAETEHIGDVELNKMLFVKPSSFRLSLSGFVKLKKIFTAFSFELPAEIMPRHKISLAKMEFPYFLTVSRLVLFSEKDSAVIKLSGGLVPFLDNYLNS